MMIGILYTHADEKNQSPYTHYTYSIFDSLKAYGLAYDNGIDGDPYTSDIDEIPGLAK